MSGTQWKAQFTQKITGYDPVDAQGLSELGFALQQSQISENEYLKWARENFELASIDLKFFQTHSAPKSLYEKWKDTYAWGPECLPIAEWEDHLLVAGLHKPEDIPAELKPLFLLAPITGLLTYWSQFQDESPQEIAIDGESAEGSGMPEGLSIDNTAAPKAQAAGLSFSGVSLATVPSASASISKTAKSEVTKKTLKSTEDIAIKIGEDTDIGIKPATKSKPAGFGTQTLSPTSQPKVPPPSATGIAVPNFKIPAAPASTLADTAIVMEGATELPEITSPEIKAQPEILSTLVANDNPISEDQIKEVFAECKKHYEKQLFIEFNDSAKTCVAKYWPAEFVATQTPHTYSLIEDSFLAIVAKTQKPYHGYVMSNFVSERFFKEVNSGELPENITVVPFLKNDIVIGCVMGWGPKSTYNLTVLRDMEKAVFQFCLKLGWVVPEAA